MISLTTWIFLRREKLVKWIFLGRENLNSFCISLAEMPYVGGNRHNFILFNDVKIEFGRNQG